MGDNLEAMLGLAIMVIFALAIYCVYIHFCKWCVEDHLKHKIGMANHYQEKYEILKIRHGYLKRSSARILRLYKTRKDGQK